MAQKVKISDKNEGYCINDLPCLGSFCALQPPVGSSWLIFFLFTADFFLAGRVKVVLLTFATSRSALVVGLYLAMVFLSPYIRRLYQPFQLRRILISHNFLCSIMNLYALIFLLHGLWEVYLIAIVNLPYSR